ncbi:MAG: hypothetical protein MZV49_06725 [Rhodopseudomonas palustris]|nr:hypothetical protein [Rhodopseudomonas palustris]
MSAALIVDLGLALSILGLGVWTIAARSNNGAVVGYIAYGLLVALSGCVSQRWMWP